MRAAGASSAWYRSWTILYLSLLTLGTVALFVVIWLSGRQDGPLNNSINAVSLLLKASAAFLTLRQLRRLWSDAGVPVRSLALAIAVALLINSVGELVWYAYTLFGIAVPYPSFADVFYLTSYVVWVIALCILFWALDTNVRDEVGPFIDILGATWSLIIVVLGLLGVSTQSVDNLLKLILDIVYPFFSALACALLGSLILGPQLRRLSAPWRWFIIGLYSSWLLIFIGDIGFSITTSLGRHSLSFELLYYDGGPIDGIYAAGDLILCWILAFTPLASRLWGESDAPDMADLGVPAPYTPR